LLFASGELDGSSTQEARARFSRHTLLELYGQTWSLVFHSTPQFDALYAQYRSWVILVAGLAITALVFLLMRFQQSTMANAQVHAEALAEELRERKRAEETLQAQKRILATILQTTADGFWIVDNQKRINQVNDAYCAMSGYSREELLSMTVNVIEAIETSEETLARMKRIIENGSELFETLHRRKDGTVFPLEVSVTHLRVYDDQLVCFFRDITERKRAEEALRKSNQENALKAELLRQTPVITAFHDRDHNIIWANKAYEEATGTLLKDFAGRKCYSAWNLSSPCQGCPVLTAVATGEPSEAELTPQNQKHWPESLASWLSRAAPVHDAEGSIIGAIEVAINITERKRMEEALKSSEERFRTAARSLSDFIYDWDMKEKINWYGDMDRLMGDSAGELPETIADWGAVIHPEDRERVMAALENHLSGVAPFAAEYRSKRKDGAWRWWSVRGTALRDEQGKPCKMIGSLSDITERKRTAEALQKSQEQFRIAQEMSPDGFTILRPLRNAQGRVVDFTWVYENQAVARLNGTKPEEVVGQHLLELFPGHRGTPILQAYQQVAESGETQIIETSYAGESMVKPTWFRLVVVPMNGDIAILAQNITEITAQKMALEAANKELEAFSYSVSHDLRAPLRHVQGYVDMLGREAESQLSEKGRRYMQVIADASWEMGVLIDELLAFSRMGRAQMNEKAVSLNELIQESIQALEMATRGRNIVWIIPQLPTVRGDPAMLGQVLTNLLDNAVKYTRSRDPAVIEVGVVDPEAGMQNENGRGEGHNALFPDNSALITFFVRDNGAGFEAQYVHKLFGVFQRLHRADEFEGNGIGLANVRRIIARHGGRTWAEGAVDKGATFYFTLKKALE
jgi:PAS domain S-box-containing protein